MKCPYCGFNDGNGSKSYYILPVSAIKRTSECTYKKSVFGCPQCGKFFMNMDKAPIKLVFKGRRD